MKQNRKSHGYERAHKSGVNYLDKQSVARELEMHCIGDSPFMEAKVREIALAYIFNWAEADDQLVGDTVPSDYVSAHIFEFYKGVIDVINSIEVLEANRLESVSPASAAMVYGFLTAISESYQVPWEILEAVAVLSGFSSLSHMLSVLRSEIVRFSKGRINKSRFSH